MPERPPTAAELDYALKLEEAHREAVADARALGNGFVLIRRKADGYLTAERLDPESVQVRDG